MPRTSDTHEHIAIEWNEFQAAWQAARATWKDGVALEFERRFVSPVMLEFPAFLDALKRVSDEVQINRHELR